MRIPSFLIAIFVFALSVSGASEASDTPELRPLSAVGLAGIAKSGEARVIVANLWATWCEPCKAEMPELIALQRKFRKRGVRLILISGDNQSELKEASEFLRKLGVDFETYHLSEPPEQFMKTFIPSWPAVLPTTVLLARDGAKLASWLNKVRIAELEKEIEKALKARPPGPGRS